MEKRPHSGRLEISLRTIGQLFNSMDPSPFYEKDLDSRAEHYLVSWAQEMPKDASLRLTLHLAEKPSQPEPERWVGEAIHNYFSERARLSRLEWYRMLRQGRTNLGIGVGFLVSCLLLSEWLANASGTVYAQVLRESLTIAGWVAMWRPLQIYLYDWWPIRQQEDIYRRMSRMPVKIKVSDSYKLQECLSLIQPEAVASASKS